MGNVWSDSFPRKQTMRPHFTSSRSLRHDDSDMIPSYLRLQEHTLILSHLEDWEQLHGLGKEPDEHRELYSSKDHLVDEVIQQLFEHFLESDSARQLGSNITFTCEEQDALHTVHKNRALEPAHITALIVCQANLLQCQEVKHTGDMLPQRKPICLSDDTLQAALQRVHYCTVQWEP
jgi:hypothetical protein